MAYTDLWRYMQCGSMPEIVTMGKNFLVGCMTCKSDKVSVYADNLGEVVREWNRPDDPTCRSLWQRMCGLFG